MNPVAHVGVEKPCIRLQVFLPQTLKRGKYHLVPVEIGKFPGQFLGKLGKGLFTARQQVHGGTPDAYFGFFIDCWQIVTPPSILVADRDSVSLPLPYFL